MGVCVCVQTSINTDNIVKQYNMGNKLTHFRYLSLISICNPEKIVFLNLHIFIAVSFIVITDILN